LQQQEWTQQQQQQRSIWRTGYPNGSPIPVTVQEVGTFPPEATERDAWRASDGRISLLI
jgi:hypothetical protein